MLMLMMYIYICGYGSFSFHTSGRSVQYDIYILRYSSTAVLVYGKDNSTRERKLYAPLLHMGMPRCIPRIAQW